MENTKKNKKILHKLWMAAAAAERRLRYNCHALFWGMTELQTGFVGSYCGEWGLRDVRAAQALYGRVGARVSLVRHLCRTCPTSQTCRTLGVPRR